MLRSTVGPSHGRARRAGAARRDARWRSRVDDAYRAEAAAERRVGRRGRPPLLARPRAAAGAERGDRRGQRRGGPPMCVVCAAGAMPGDLHKLWRTRDPKGYHVEYGYSCMGYEIAGGIGVKLAAPEREVFVLVGDGSYLMMPGELVTAVQEGVKLTVVLVDNHGFNSIGALSRSLGIDGFGTQYRFARDGRAGPRRRRRPAADAAARPRRERCVTSAPGRSAPPRSPSCGTRCPSAGHRGCQRDRRRGRSLRRRARRTRAGGTCRSQRCRSSQPSRRRAASTRQPAAPSEGFVTPYDATRRHCLWDSDGPGRSRTCDLGIKSPLLYQLSYRPRLDCACRHS